MRCVRLLPRCEFLLACFTNNPEGPDLRVGCRWTQHYPCFLALDEPLEEEKFTKVVRELAAQDNIKEKHCQIDFMDEAPNDWHDGATDGSGSFQANHYVKGKIPKKGCCNPGNKTENVVMWGMVPGISTPRLKNRMKIRVFNAKEEGKPTVMW
jgi:hypothetical protein